MIRTTLPIRERTLDEKSGAMVAKESEIAVTVDTSVYAEERWEIHFPQNAARETLFAYIERLGLDRTGDGRARVLSGLKAIYCFLEGDRIADYKSFCQLFDLSDEDYLRRLTARVGELFSMALGGSATSAKN